VSDEREKRGRGHQTSGATNHQIFGAVYKKGAVQVPWNRGALRASSEVGRRRGEKFGSRVKPVRGGSARFPAAARAERGGRWGSREGLAHGGGVGSRTGGADAAAGSISRQRDLARIVTRTVTLAIPL
jgi:hypothetical protein